MAQTDALGCSPTAAGDRREPKAFFSSLSRLDLVYVREIREVSNRWANFEPFSDADTVRALDTTVRLSRAANAAGEATAVSELVSGLQQIVPGTAAADLTQAAGELGSRAIYRGQVLAGSTTLARSVDVGPVEDVVAFHDRDQDYLAWIKAHRGGYVLNTGPHGGGNAVLHRAACGTISRRPPFTSGSYIKVCSSPLESLDRWMLGHAGSNSKRCGLCHPP